MIDAPGVFRKKPGKKNQERPFSIFQPSPVAAQFPASGTRSFMPLGAFDRGGKVARNAPGFQLFDTSYRRFFASSLMIVLLMFYFVQLLFHLFSPMLIIMNLLYNHTDVEWMYTGYTGIPIICSFRCLIILRGSIVMCVCVCSVQPWRAWETPQLLWSPGFVLRTWTSNYVSYARCNYCGINKFKIARSRINNLRT